jgi:hypothetical protein
MKNPLDSSTARVLRKTVQSLLKSKQATPPLFFQEVLEKELKVIQELRRRSSGKRETFAGSTSFECAHNAELLGLSFSGGGIRSATFNLGVLQALAKMKMLHCFDYISTVSGGGYIGSWLATWISRAGGVKQIETFLDPDLSPNEPKVRPIGFLREYSNYLTPSLGLLGVDTWTMIAIWMRNCFLNLLILTISGAAVLILPLLLFRLYDYLVCKVNVADLKATSLLLFLFASVFIALNLRWFAKLRTDASKKPNNAFYTQPKWIRRLIVLPTFASGFCLSALVFRLCWEDLQFVDALSVGAIFFLFLMLIQILAGFYSCFQSNLEHDVSRLRQLRSNLKSLLLFLLYPALAIGVGVGSLWMIAKLNLLSELKTESLEWVAMSWGTLILLGLLALVETIHVGLMGKNLPDDRREWWGRLTAWCFIYSIGFAAIVGLSVWGPGILDFLTSSITRKSGFILTWLGTTAGGIAAGKSPLSSGASTNQSSVSRAILRFFLKVAPLVFIVGLFLILSQAVTSILTALTGAPPGENLSRLTHIARSSELSFPTTLLAFLLCTAVAVCFSLTVDINEFSMHHFYKNRLVRCYLGASRSETRCPNSATGFDRDDDKLLATFLPYPNPDCPADKDPIYDGPMPIINATLNLVHGENLAWQQRKGASFFWTPLYSGFEIPETEKQCAAEDNGITRQSFRQTTNYGYPNGGIHIGTAMAISGAAANPNMGFHSSAAAAFLMTVFDVRLGWWLGNPKSEATWQRSGPTFGLGYLIKELLGLTNERGGFINLSDGGHFENLGIYELVRRRCRFIVVCDAEEDLDLGFGGLGNAIRKCREDFGVKIEIDVGQIRPGADTKLSKTHCVVGKIKYPDRPGVDGILVYLKSSLTGDEPEDVSEFKFHHPEFPHDSTANQWFTESQFESYRQLGSHVTEKTFEPAFASEDLLSRNKSAFFKTLQQFWYPPSVDVDRFFTKHAAAYDALMNEIRKDPSLGDYLDSGMFPELKATLPGKGLNSDQLNRRSAFYFCTSLIQLMENVYLDLNLEDNLTHPDNAGWIRVFTNWANNPTFREAWKFSHHAYGLTFQSWCVRNFLRGFEDAADL